MSDGRDHSDGEWQKTLDRLFPGGLNFTGDGNGIRFRKLSHVLGIRFGARQRSGGDQFDRGPYRRNEIGFAAFVRGRVRVGLRHVLLFDHVRFRNLRHGFHRDHRRNQLQNPQIHVRNRDVPSNRGTRGSENRIPRSRLRRGRRIFWQRRRRRRRRSGLTALVDRFRGVGRKRLQRQHRRGRRSRRQRRQHFVRRDRRSRRRRGLSGRERFRAVRGLRRRGKSHRRKLWKRNDLRRISRRLRRLTEPERQRGGRRRLSRRRVSRQHLVECRNVRMSRPRFRHFWNKHDVCPRLRRRGWNVLVYRRGRHYRSGELRKRRRRRRSVRIGGFRRIRHRHRPVPDTVDDRKPLRGNAEGFFNGSVIFSRKAPPPTRRR